MKKCTNPEIGQMIGRYEFNLLDPAEKDAFESHLIKCDACFQDLYEFSPVARIIKENKKEFSKAVTDNECLANRILASTMKIIHIIKDQVKKILSSLPGSLRPAIPALAAVIVLIIITLVAKNSYKPDDFANISDIDNNINHNESQNVTLHDPEEMETKGSTDIASTLDTVNKKLSVPDMIRISESMQAVQDQYNERIIFSWVAVDSIKYYHIELINNEKHIRITPAQGITDNHFSYRLKDFDKNLSYSWEISGEMINGKKFRLEPKSIIFKH